MPFTTRVYLFTVWMLLCLSMSACAAPLPPTALAAPPAPTPTPIAGDLPRVTLPNSQIRTFQSAHTSRTYDLYISLPESYAGNTTRHYPVLYVLDGQWDFKLLDSISGGLLYDQFIPEIIIVGVTYNGDKPNYSVLRSLDYSPPAEVMFWDYGEADKFLACLKEEIIPLIETNYRADSTNRTLMGSSLGGLFTLYSLLTEPELFSGYVSASPAVTFAGGVIFDLETEFAAQHKTLPVKLFVSVGEKEQLNRSVKSFVEALNNSGYEELVLETRIIEGERHSGSKPESFNRGLRFIFQGDK